jgi:uncharacterized protein YdaU (DUF1376 family)
MYPKDFLADTQLLSAEEVGAYWLLCCSAWVGLPGYEQGFLPADDRSLATLARLTPERWELIGTPIRAMFAVDEEGRLFHKRLLRELEHQQARSAVARQSALRRHGLSPVGTPTTAGTPATEKEGTPSSREPKATLQPQVRSHMQTHSERICERSAAGQTKTQSKTQLQLQPQSKGGGEVEGPGGGAGRAANADPDGVALDLVDFERFWLAYPRRARKTRTLEAWRESAATRPPIGELLERIAVMADSAEWNRDAGQYIPTSLTFLAEQRWLDAVTPRPGGVERPPSGGQDLDIGDRLSRLAAAVQEAGLGAPILASQILALSSIGSAELVEQRLAEIDRDMLRAAELQLTEEDRAALDRQVLLLVRRDTVPGATRHQIDDASARFRRRLLRRDRGLPLLSLFGPLDLGEGSRERGAA